MPLWVYLFLHVSNVVPESNESRNKILLYFLKINGTYMIKQYKSLDLAISRYSWKYLRYKHYTILTSSKNIQFSPWFCSNFLYDLGNLPTLLKWLVFKDKTPEHRFSPNLNQTKCLLSSLRAWHQTEHLNQGAEIQIRKPKYGYLTTTTTNLDFFRLWLPTNPICMIENKNDILQTFLFVYFKVIYSLNFKHSHLKVLSNFCKNLSLHIIS